MILITGGNGGLGLGAAKTFVEHGATVLLACRTMRSCDAAVAEVAPFASRFSSSPFQPAASFRDGHVAAVQVRGRGRGRGRVRVRVSHVAAVQAALDP